MNADLTLIGGIFVMKKATSLLLSFALCVVLLLSGCSVGQTTTSDSQSKSSDATMRTIEDMRGKSVQIPTDIQRVAIFDKGFVVQCMAAMGIEDKIVASGNLVQTATKANERDSLYLYPQLLELPQLGYPTDAVDFERLAEARPDVVILRNSEFIKDSEITAGAIKKIEEDLKLPLIVINGPGCYDDVTIETQYEGIRLMGELFNTQDRAEEIIEIMQEPLDMIMERTKNIAEEDKPSVMYIGGLKGTDISGTVWGSNYGDAKFSEDTAHIRNVHSAHEAIRKVSAEQIITLNPEVIILCTVSPTPETFLNDPLYESLRKVPAVENERVASLGLLTWWGDFRLEIPTILLISAKSVYPDQFADINVGEWLNDYHSSLYNLTEEQAQELKEVQELGWMDSAGF